MKLSAAIKVGDFGFLPSYRNWYQGFAQAYPECSLKCNPDSYDKMRRYDVGCSSSDSGDCGHAGHFVTNCHHYFSAPEY